MFFGAVGTGMSFVFTDRKWANKSQDQALKRWAMLATYITQGEGVSST